MMQQSDAYAYEEFIVVILAYNEKMAKCEYTGKESVKRNQNNVKAVGFIKKC